MYNQCANLVLENAVKKADDLNHRISSIDDKQDLSPMIKPGDIDCMIAGFPW